MLPRLPPVETSGSAYAAFLNALRTAGFEGDLSAADGDRTVLATDNSIYRLVPQAIASPRGADDLSRIGRLLAEPRFERIYGLIWGRHVAAPDGADRVLATGYSCGSQAKRLDGVALPDPARVLLRALRLASETTGSAPRPAAKPPQRQAGASPAGTGAPSPQAELVAG